MIASCDLLPFLTVSLRNVTFKMGLEINFDKISTTIHKKYIGLTSMVQGFQKCIA